MLNTKTFLAVDFGAGSLKLAEFEVNESGGLRLKQYGIKPLGAEGAQDSAREAVVQKAMAALMTELGIRARTVNVCAPGFHVFSKFVKLPPVDTGKVTQIVQYEAQQNVPFPLEEVVWDYQILGKTAGGEQEVLLVAIKSEIVEGLFRITENAGLKLQVADVSAAALCNSFRYNYGDLEDCTMLLDIGAKTSNLLFFEKGKVYARSLSLGANSITQDFASESKKKFDVAEKIKIDEGFVSLGGAYEEPENQDQAAISKIARQFMTRLHIQVNQTMQFYRGQQGGSAPVRLFLSGGASVMPYTAQFFAEKLNVPVEYFNPLRNVQIDPSLNLEDLARVAHSLGEVVGLGLRNLARCPIELNLMPASTLRWQTFNEKKPYFIATVFSLVLVVAAMAFLFDKLAGVKQAALEDTHREVEPLQMKAQQFQAAYKELQKSQKDEEQIVAWMADRYYWVDVLTAIREGMIRAENAMRTRLRTETGVWIDQFVTGQPQTDLAVEEGAATTAPVTPGFNAAEQEMFMRRYGIRPGGMGAPGMAEAPMPGVAPGMEAPQPEGGAPVMNPDGTPALNPDGTPMLSAKKGATNEIDNITITFRAVSLNSIQPDANKEMLYSVLNELRNNPLFDPKETKDTGTIGTEESPGTFTFGITVKLKQPLKL